MSVCVLRVFRLLWATLAIFVESSMTQGERSVVPKRRQNSNRTTQGPLAIQKQISEEPIWRACLQAKFEAVYNVITFMYMYTVYTAQTLIDWPTILDHLSDHFI